MIAPPLPPLRTQAAPCRRAAFTLIELLTVIAIIGILAAIIIPTVGRVRASAKAAACASNLRQLASACLLYSSENKNLLIPIASGSSPTGTGAKTWRILAAPYLGQKNGIGVLGCPSDEKISTFDEARGLLPPSYGINRTIGLHEYLTVVPQSKSVTSVVSPSLTILASDISFVDNPSASANEWTDNNRSLGSGNFGYARFPSDGSFTGDPWIPFPRHANKLNAAFYDGHVESVAPSRMLDNAPGQAGCIYDNN